MSESILEEAQRITHGSRNADYGHPLDDYTRTAALVSALLAHKLMAPIEPHEMALAMVCVKLSRQINRPKRDNMVDAAGYAWVSWECIEEEARRMAALRKADEHEQETFHPLTSPIPEPPHFPTCQAGVCWHPPQAAPVPPVIEKSGDELYGDDKAAMKRDAVDGWAYNPPHDGGCNRD